MSLREPEPLPIGDPRLAPFSSVVGRRRGPLAVVEGAIPTQRACASGMPVEAVVCTPSQVEGLRRYVPAQSAWWVAPKSVLSEMLGYSFHRGVLASVRVPGPGEIPVDTLTALRAPLVAAAVGFTDPANVGALVRAARALDVDHVLIDADGADPFARKAVRASAGHVFSVGMTLCDGLLESTLRLRDTLGAELLALTPCGETGLHELNTATGRIVAFGSEGPGLPDVWLEAATARVQIELAHDVDSLNVAAASAVTFYALGRARA